MEKINEDVCDMEPSKEGEKVKMKKGKGKTEELMVEIEKLTQERDQYLSGWQRERAEFENFRKRSNAEKDEMYRFVKEDTVGKFLDVLDNLERALESASKEADAEVLLSGIDMVHKQMLEVLKRCDVVPIEAQGEMFDPNMHEVVQTEVREDLPEGTILRELRRGYAGVNRTVRPSVVMVSKQN